MRITTAVAEGQVFVWKEGSRFAVPAQVVGETILRICEQEGACPAERLVDEARPEGSPLHPAFDWDDASAAEKHRAEQARHMSRSVRVLVRGQEDPTPFFVSVKIVEVGDGLAGYKPLIRLTSMERKQVENDALAALNGLRRRFAHLTRFSRVWREVDRLNLEDLG